MFKSSLVQMFAIRKPTFRVFPAFSVWFISKRSASHLHQNSVEDNQFIKRNYFPNYSIKFVLFFVFISWLTSRLHSFKWNNQNLNGRDASKESNSFLKTLFLYLYFIFVGGRVATPQECARFLFISQFRPSIFLPD